MQSDLPMALRIVLAVPVALAGALIGFVAGAGGSFMATQPIAWVVVLAMGREAIWPSQIVVLWIAAIMGALSAVFVSLVSVVAWFRRN